MNTAHHSARLRFVALQRDDILQVGFAHLDGASKQTRLNESAEFM